MSDYFDKLEVGLGEAIRARRHLPWYARAWQLSLRHRGLAVVIAALVVATPTVTAVGAVSGWFGRGAPDRYYPASATSGLGKVLPKDGVLLPIRVADPDGGPPWGIRLVKTTRDETCIQVGRVQNGQIGALGIDGAWGDDHEFHEIKPNDQLADICGATDAAGYGYVNQAAHGAPASVDVPLYNSGGASGRCRSPFAPVTPEPLTRAGAKLPSSLKQQLERVEAEKRKDPRCPASAMRMVFAGLLGPDAKSVTYKTPDGRTETEQTSGGVGAYLIVFRETASNCQDFTRTALGGGTGCQSDGTGGSADLQGPTAVTGVTYASGKTCTDVPSQSLAADWRSLGSRIHGESGKRERQATAQFLAAHHLTQRSLFQALMPRCSPVGWVASKQRHLTAVSVASPIKVTMVEGTRFCVGKTQIGSFNGAVPCDSRVPRGDRFLYATRPARKAVLVSFTFTAHQAATTTDSYYEFQIRAPGNHGSEGNRTQENIRAGQKVTFSLFESLGLAGTYHGTIAFMQNAGQSGPDGGLAASDLAGSDGSIVVGHFSFQIPPKR